MEKIINAINKNNTFALFAHISPDPDALGSCKALKLALEKLGKTAYIFCDGKISFNNTFLNIHLEENVDLINSCDILIAVDTSSLERLGKYREMFVAHKNTLCIDHHTNPTNYAKVNFIKDKYSSTALIVIEILEKLNVKIDSEIAEILYAGISSDTGCFKHANTEYLAHIRAAELIKVGFDLEKCNFELFKKRNNDFVKFLKTIIPIYKVTKSGIGMLFINFNTYKKIKDNYDADYINEIFAYDNTKFFVLIAEKEKGIFKLGFRSRAINVEKIAKAFGGGGHVLASGAVIKTTKKEVLKILNEQIEKVLNDRDNKHI